MKYILIISAAIAFSSAAIACPNLQGTYSCNSIESVLINQSTDAGTGNIEYSVGANPTDGQLYITDGAYHNVNEMGGYTASCEGDTLMVVESVTGAGFKPVLRYSLDGSNLIYEIGMMTGGVFKSVSKEPCAKQ